MDFSLTSEQKKLTKNGNFDITEKTFNIFNNRGQSTALKK